jgi:hypothetical protein
MLQVGATGIEVEKEEEEREHGRVVHTSQQTYRKSIDM